MNAFLTETLQRITAGEDLDEGDAEALFDEIMGGRVTSLLVAALLAALKTKGESPSEIVGAARAMRRAALKIDAQRADLVDTCGTGGDRSGTFNISTAAAIVAAAAGARVAKHGNRAASSHCGSADVLEELGVAIDLGPYPAAACLARTGITFLFAPLYHPAMRHAIEARRELRLPTIFNYLGPLTNPAGVRRQVLGTPNLPTFERVASVVGELGYEHCIVVHGLDGLDEVSLSGPSRVAEWRRGELRERVVHPQEFGLRQRALSALRGGDAAENAAAMRSLLSGRGRWAAEWRGSGEDARLSLDAAADVVALNAGCALYVAGVTPTWEGGVGRALEVLAEGEGLRKLDEWVRTSRAVRDLAERRAAEDPAGQDHSLHDAPVERR